MAIKTILFDVADTLLHKPGLVPAIREELARHGLDFDPDEIARIHRIARECFTFPDKTGCEFYLEFNTRFLEVLGVMPHQAIVEGIYNSCSKLPWMPFADTESLSELCCPVGVISNWDSSLREKLSRHFAVEFSPIIVSEEAGFAKPDVRIYKMALEATGLEPEEVMFVGDSIRLDIVPALSLGFRAVLIDRSAWYTNFNGHRIKSLDVLTSLMSRQELDSFSQE